MKLKINYATLLQLVRTNKAFIFIDYKDDKLLGYKLSNDYDRYKNKFDTFRVVSTLQKEINNLNIQHYHKKHIFDPNNIDSVLIFISNNNDNTLINIEK